MPATSPLSSQTEHAFSFDPFSRVHDKGHAAYLLRYRTAAGAAFAVGRTTKTEAKVWIPADERWKAALRADGFDCVERDCAHDVAAGPTIPSQRQQLASKRPFQGLRSEVRCWRML